MVDMNAFGTAMGALPRFDSSAIVDMPASTPGVTQEPMRSASTSGGLPLYMKVQASGIINPLTRRGITTTKPLSPEDVPNTGNTPGGSDVYVPGDGFITEDAIGGIPKKTLMVGGLVFAAGLVALSVLRG
jgi:hypothetical protein